MMLRLLYWLPRVLGLGFALLYVVLVGTDRHWSWYVSIAGPALVMGSLFFSSLVAEKV